MANEAIAKPGRLKNLTEFAKAFAGAVFGTLDTSVEKTMWVPKSMMADEIHPTDAGYDIWMTALEPVLNR